LQSYLSLVAVTNFTLWMTGASGFFYLALNVYGLAASTAGVALATLAEALAFKAYELERKLEQAAHYDSLSGARTRGSFLELAQAALKRARKDGTEATLLMLDIDCFKSINDTHGHPVGDEVIRTLARTCQELLGTSHLFGRLGGEEFAMLLPGANLAAAKDFAEKLRETVSGKRVPAKEGALRFTVSAGLAAWRAGEDALDHLLARADAALYDAKHGGRNQVRSFAA